MDVLSQTEGATKGRNALVRERYALRARGKGGGKGAGNRVVNTPRAYKSVPREQKGGTTLPAGFESSGVKIGGSGSTQEGRKQSNLFTGKRKPL